MFLKDYYPKLNKKFNKVKFNGIAFDSNLVKKDYIFFAIKGNKFDGNKSEARLLFHFVRQLSSKIPEYYL